MGIFDGCLLVSDIDGTLMSHGTICARNCDAIARFQNAGGIFTIATGRNVQAALPALQYFTCNAPAIVYNGGMLYDYAAETALAAHTISDAGKDIFFRMMEQFPAFGAEMHHDRQIYVLRATSETDWHVAYEKIPPVDLTPSEARPMPWHKTVFTLDREPAEPAIEFFNAHASPDACRIVLSSAIDAGRDHLLLEMLPAGVSKATLLPELKAHTKARFVCTIGDYDNDLELLEAADFCGAPSNATPTVLAAADARCGACEDGAVADFIDAIEAWLEQSK